MGENVVLAAHIPPEYVQAGQRFGFRLNYRYGAGIFGFNRMTLEVRAAPPSTGLRQREPRQVGGGARRAMIDVDIAGPFSSSFAQAASDALDYGRREQIALDQPDVLEITRLPARRKATSARISRRQLGAHRADFDCGARAGHGSGLVLVLRG
jgi:hypothetical protein